MADWTIYKENSSSEWELDGTIKRSNSDLETTITATTRAIDMADGSKGYFTPETKKVREPFTMFFADTTSALRTKIETYMLNGTKVKIVTHTSEELIGQFISMKRVWLCGVTDAYDVQVSFLHMES